MQKFELAVSPPLFRLGTTSYIIPDEILPNVRYLANKVDDIELVLFEVDEGQNNLPDATALKELKQLSVDHSLTYTVHLPLDLRLGTDDDERHLSIEKAQRVMERTRAISPHAFVLHLDGREVKENTDPDHLKKWVELACRSIEIVAGWAGDLSLLAVENLEGYPPEFWDPVLDRVAASRCVDIGHLWLDGQDPLPFLERCLSRVRVIHIHGIGKRDHASLTLVPPAELDRIVRLLLEQKYTGVLTIEVFSEADFLSSRTALDASLVRVQKEIP